MLIYHLRSVNEATRRAVCYTLGKEEMKWLCRPLQICICLTADKYTFIVPCEMLEEARCDMNKVWVHSDVGTA